MKSVALILLLGTCATALQLSSFGAATRAAAFRPSILRLMAEPVDKTTSAEPMTITDEQIASAAKAASAPGAEPSADPFAGVVVEKREPEKFDPRLIVYVSIPAIVLVAQLFFTFSRDMMAGDVVGPAVMDLFIQ